MRDDFSVSSKRIVVLGASGAIGSAICDSLSGRGAKVVGADIRPPERVCERAWQFVDLDALDEAAVSALAAEEAAAGIDALICAQGATGQVSDAEHLDMDDFRQCITLSVDASAIAVKHFVPLFKRVKSGSVILLSSTAGLRGNALMPAYTAAKHGVLGLVRSYARELGPWGIRVNAILPGLIESPMAVSIVERLERRLDANWTSRGRLPEQSANNVPLRRIGTVDDIANAAIFLVSDASSYCNGTLLNVDGGLLVRT